MMTELDRRNFLRLGSSTLVLLGGAPIGALARSAGRQPVLVVVFQRGAADALHMLVPYRDPKYRELRGALALEEPGRGENPTLDLGGGFAFHPALSPLYPLYKSGRLAPIINVGSPDATRSHFDAQDYMESGTPGLKSTRDGWLARTVEALALESPSRFTGVSLTSQMPRSLSGTHDAMALEDFATISFPPRSDPITERIERLYREDSSALFADAGADAFVAMRLFRDRDPLSHPTSPGVHYPRSRKSNPLEQLARLIKADLGVRVAFVESGGWDTHFAQGGATGTMADLMSPLAGSVAAFVEDVGETCPVTMLLVTEFGRTVALNGAGGTDHGHGGAMMIIGPGVRGGRVHGDWLGLAKRNLYEGRDLPVMTDFRDVFFEVAGTALAPLASAALFPGYRPQSVAVMSRG
jgi:uncharacterized protein (DUF1501 family)